MSEHSPAHHEAPDWADLAPLRASCGLRAPPCGQARGAPETRVRAHADASERSAAYCLRKRARSGAARGCNQAERPGTSCARGRCRWAATWTCCGRSSRRTGCRSCRCRCGPSGWPRCCSAGPSSWTCCARCTARRAPPRMHGSLVSYRCSFWGWHFSGRCKSVARSRRSPVYALLLLECSVGNFATCWRHFRGRLDLFRLLAVQRGVRPRRLLPQAFGPAHSAAGREPGPHLETRHEKLRRHGPDAA